MQYRRFGKTNLQLSIFSLGTMRCLASAEVMRSVLAAAVARGINHIETARGYGQSEALIGQALQAGIGKPREALILTTKLTPTDADSVERQLDDSLARLGIDYIDCLAIHGINTPEHLAQVRSGMLSAISRLTHDGRVRHVGFSTHGSLDLILAAIATDAFAFINLHYYYFFQRNLPAVELAHQKDMGVFIISPGDSGAHRSLSV
ncbi:MAG: hypothetical protein F6J97_20860 [Leptolyngbya sp. SIO4C1]|nr:hypothetical protein [Leptolyngbya sp. SIO4C1]